jgi:S-adenosylmethionine synthetase
MSRQVCVNYINFARRVFMNNNKIYCNPNCDTEVSLFTSESVTMGHPDKICDHVSDAILDALLAKDAKSRVAIETTVKNGLVLISGEVTTSAVVDVAAIARQAIKNIGYTDPMMGFDCVSCAVVVNLDKQSPDISQGVTEGQGLHQEQGAGDQGIMFGYACKETKELMPMPIQLAHMLTIRLEEARQKKQIKWLRPDGKTQVTVEYHNGKPTRVHTVVVSTQHDPDVSHSTIVKTIKEKIIKPVMPKGFVDSKTIYHINPTGRFVIGGPHGDCGVTGRKIIVDTYGGRGRHGGGAFSGKDPSKVDRTASYMARYIAKNIVAADLADACEVQLSYAIGVAEPVSVLVNTEGTAKVSEKKISEAVKKLFPMTPKGMINHLKLARPIYEQTSYGGHFGRNLPGFTWEKTDMVKALRAAVGLK